MTERTRFTAYITKYALTTGIREIEVEDCFNISPGMVSTIGGYHQCYHANNWHRTRQEAANRAEQMRKAKIASLKRSLAKIEGLKFT